MDPVSLSVEVWEDEAIGTSNSTSKKICEFPCRLKGVHIVGIPTSGATETSKPGYVLLFDQDHDDSFNDADIKMRMRYGKSISMSVSYTHLTLPTKA